MSNNNLLTNDTGQTDMEYFLEMVSIQIEMG